MTSSSPDIRLVVVALGRDTPPDTVTTLVDAARAQALAAGRRLVEPVPVLVAGPADLPGARWVAVPAWGDLVPETTAPGAVGAVRRIVAGDVRALACLVGARHHRRLLATADVVVAADAASRLTVWSLRRSRTALVAGAVAMHYALGRVLER